MATSEIAHALVDLCKQGKFEDAINKHYGTGIVSVEPMGEPAAVEGLEAVLGKLQWFHNTMEIHGMEISGPYINGSQFAVRFILDATNKLSGKRASMDEIGVYTVEGDKIVHEAFFFGE